ncbi:hypothetical protein TSUD_05050 [Trifolium subterraneum]|uniref:Uncharacterized protein n=1 Tax=Trifolium subterraneum TaxID=3900 RepID=A0A2Z6NCV9_TRISU|nr:hypothetical protein TSUD_05050 [Trifolium subterraneum]
MALWSWDCLNDWSAVNNAQGRRGLKLHRAAGTEVNSTLLLHNQQAVSVAADLWAAPEIRMLKCKIGAPYLRTKPVITCYSVGMCLRDDKGSFYSGKYDVVASQPTIS